MTILVDSREQLPYSFNGYPVQVKRVTLKTGDYSLEGHSDKITVERKVICKKHLYSQGFNGKLKRP